MKITKYPQSCFLVELKDKRILIDPGSYVYSALPLKPENWQKIDVILFTHEHSDHFDLESLKIILRNNQPKIITNQAVQGKLKDAGIESLDIEPGEMTNVDNVEFMGVKSKHGPLPGGGQPPEVIGFLIDRQLLHLGDTVKSDKVPAEIVLIPMCGQVCFSPKDAVKYLKKIKPQLAIPMHYHNENYITDTAVFAKAFEEAKIPYRILEERESITV
ncbi:MAG: MBL fold metallo-hydrolase [Patescibacteria group bacterium]|nr:MBL fold metallo-hydrolase [Patescibacteria group bacterium]